MSRGSRARRRLTRDDGRESGSNFIDVDKIGPGFLEGFAVELTRYHRHVSFRRILDVRRRCYVVTARNYYANIDLFLLIDVTDRRIFISVNGGIDDAPG